MSSMEYESAERFLAENLPNYRVLRPLARSHTATVFLGEHVYLSTRVAIKLFSQPLAVNDVQVFEARVQSIARLEHPHIVRFLEYTLVDGHPCLVTEFAPGGTLRDRHPRGAPLNLSTSALYLQQIAQALQYCHEQGVVHGDLKPENLLFDADDRLLLHDFSLAPASTSLAEEQETFGTVFYMAPEQLRGTPVPATDQYALAIMIWEWLAGSPPFQGTYAEVVAQQMAAPLPALRNEYALLDPDLVEALTIALRKEPEQRFFAVQAFARACQQAYEVLLAKTENMSTAISSDPFVAFSLRKSPGKSEMTPSTLSPDLPQEHKRLSRRLLLYGLGLGSAMLAGGGGYAWWLENRLTRKNRRTTRAVPKATPTPVAPGTLLYTYGGHKSEVLCLSWSSDGTRIASSDMHELHLWQIGEASKTIKMSHLLPASSLLASGFLDTPYWSPDDKLVTTVYELPQGEKPVLALWNTTNGQLVKKSSVPDSDYAWVLNWLPDSQHLRVLAQNQHNINPDILSVAIQEWDISSAISIKTLPLPGINPHDFILQASERSVNYACMGFSNDGTYILFDERLSKPITYIKDVNTGKVLCTINPPFFLDIQSISWSQNNELIAFKRGSASIYETRTGKLLSKIGEDGDISSQSTIVLSPDGRYAAFNKNKEVIVFEVSTGQTVVTYRGHVALAAIIAWSPDSKRLATACISDPSIPAPDLAIQVWQAVAD